jgi:hypothetical protein
VVLSVPRWEQRCRWTVTERRIIDDENEMPSCEEVSYLGLSNKVARHDRG